MYAEHKLCHSFVHDNLIHDTLRYTINFNTFCFVLFFRDKARVYARTYLSPSQDIEHYYWHDIIAEKYNQREDC